MLDSESIKKMLRSVLQSSKLGVSVNRLQSEYQSLCGETIPLKKLGFSRMEDYLQSIPSVVRLQYCNGELRCFAAVCRETAHIAELVARQKTSKKSGRSQLVNCRMRFKPSNPYTLNVRPRSSLRQPSAGGDSKWISNRYQSHPSYGGTSASGDYRKLDHKLSAVTPVEHRQPAVKQSVLTGRNMRNLPNSEMPKEMLPKKLDSPDPSQPCVYEVELVQRRMTQLLEKYCSGVWMSKLLGLYSEMFSQKLSPQVLTDLEKWTHICTVEKPSSTLRADRLVYPALPPKDTNPRSLTVSNTTRKPAFSRSSSPDQSSLGLLPTPALLPSAALHPSSGLVASPGLLPTPALCVSAAIHPAPVSKPAVHPRNLLAKPTFIFPPEPVASSGKLLQPVTLRSPAHNPALAPRLAPCASLAVNANGGCKDNQMLNKNTPNNTLPFTSNWNCPGKTKDPQPSSSVSPTSDILPLLKVTFSPNSESAPHLPLKSSAPILSDDVCQKMKDLLSRYSNGLWAHGLPKLFMDTYKTPFPEHVLENLSLLLNVCDVEYPVPGNKRKAILYNSSRSALERKDSPESQQSRNRFLPSGLDLLSPVIPPKLNFPSEQYPSVLVTDALSCNAVTIRYVGVNYSNAQEAMEEAMCSFYSSTHHPVSRPVVGQLVAVRGDDGEELARAQVINTVAPDKVKVYYVDYGFSVETSGTNLLMLHQDFLSLPFQATNVRLAGLEAFSSQPEVLSALDQLAVGKILLMETLEACDPSELPVVVLYDTSQEDDININSACLKALQDSSMNNPLTANATYLDVCVTDVCANGIIHCQLPSRGTTRLKKLLEEAEAIFDSQMTSELLVSRPFSGKICLARYKGKWSRAKITNMYGNRVTEILFIDMGVQATLEVTDLREIPPGFLKDFAVIPPQVLKCCLAELKVPDGDWNPKAVLWLKEAILGSEDCKIKISKLDKNKEDLLVYMYLFIGTESQKLEDSINYQLAQSDLWKKLTRLNSNNNNAINSSMATGPVGRMTMSSHISNTTDISFSQAFPRAQDASFPDATYKNGTELLPIPPPLELPQAGQNMDVFVPVACHPGYFVLQPWQDLHKLVVLMGEMILYYNQTSKTNEVPNIVKGEIYAAKIDKNWHRVQVKGILSTGLVSVYELDYGKHELVHNTLLRLLIEEFRQLPFQAITAQLAGLTQTQWSEEASMLFRNHVENRALVAQVESVQEASEVKGELWERRLTVYLVDTTLEERDLWIHSIMADLGGELSSAA